MAVYSTSTSVESDTTLVTEDAYGGTVPTYPSSTTWPADPAGMFPDTIRFQTTVDRYEWVVQPTWSRRQMPTEADLDTYWSEAQRRMRLAGHKIFNNTTERDTIVTSPVDGEMVYIENTGQILVWTGATWRSIRKLNGTEFVLDSSSLDGSHILV